MTSPEDILIVLGIAKRSGPTSLSELRDDLSEDERRVFEIIHTPVPRDSLIEALELPITDANVLPFNNGN